MIHAVRLKMGREPMVWWVLAATFAFMLVLAANLFAGAVRDAFDPRLNRTEIYSAVRNYGYSKHADFVDTVLPVKLCKNHLTGKTVSTEWYPAMLCV